MRSRRGDRERRRLERDNPPGAAAEEAGEALNLNVCRASSTMRPSRSRITRAGRFGQRRAVGGDDDGHTRCTRFGQQPDEVALGRRIHFGGRLVGKQHGGRAGQRDGKTDPGRFPADNSPDSA